MFFAFFWCCPLFNLRVAFAHTIGIAMLLRFGSLRGAALRAARARRQGLSSRSHSSSSSVVVSLDQLERLANESPMNTTAQVAFLEALGRRNPRAVIERVETNACGQSWSTKGIRERPLEDATTAPRHH